MKIINKIKEKLNNNGSTMVEVLVGFTLLVMIIVECMVHIVGVSSNMIQKSVDMQRDVLTMNEQMYRKDAVYEKVAGTTITLELDTTKTASENGAESIVIPASQENLYFFDCVDAGLKIFVIRYMN